MKQLEEGMFFFLASLPKDNYIVLQELFHKYESGQLIKLPISKLLGQTGKVDYKYIVTYNEHSLAFSTLYTCI